MAYSSTNPVNLVGQGIVGGKIWDYVTTEGSTVVLTTAAYFTDGYTRGMRLGDIILARGTSAGSSYTFAMGIVSSVNSTAGTAGPSLLSILISTA